jgi:polysaccharide pyruvyl transferase WcaK-like protein
MDKKRLSQVLDQLIEEGKLTAETKAEIFTGVESRAHESHRNVLAEIGGYLGGAFVIVSAGTFTAQKFQDISTAIRFSLFLALAILLGAIAIFLGTKSAVKARLSSVLGLGSAISVAGSITMLLNDNKAPTSAFTAATIVAAFFFFKNRNEVLHIGTYFFLFVLCTMVASTIIDRDEDGASLMLTSILWLVLAIAWIFLAFKNEIQKTLGYAFSVATIFIAIQVQFLQEERALSYFLAAVSSLALARLFLKERSWPLLPGAVIIITFSVGEFVAATLGGSFGALIGLFAAGVALITTSLYAIRTIKQ